MKIIKALWVVVLLFMCLICHGQKMAKPSDCIAGGLFVGNLSGIPAAGSCKNSQTAGSGQTITVTNSLGGITGSFELLVSGTPATASIPIKGCKLGGTCDLLTTSTSTSNSIFEPTPATVYDYFTIAPTFTGGSAPTLTVNTTITMARGGNLSPTLNLQNTTQFPSSSEERDSFGGYFGSYLRGTQANIESGANIIGIVNYFGDSMTRGDGLTSVLRNYLQTDWFDGGPGWCSANYTYGAVWPADCQLTADTGSGAPAGTWTDCVHGAGGSGCTGNYTANGPDLMTTISNDTSTPAAKRITCENVDQMQLWYVQQPNGGSFEYTFDSAGEATTVSTAGTLSLKVLDWATIKGSAIGNGTHYVNFKITVAGSGSSGDACQGSSSGTAQTCILGAYCINDIGGGMVVNKNGATGSTSGSWAQFITNNSTMFAAELAQFQTFLHTAVVSNVFMDGANDLVANVTPATLVGNTSTLISFLQTQYPNADEWIASEPDNGTTGLTYTMGAYAHAQQDLARGLSNGSGCFPANGITTQAQCVGYLGHYENMWNYDRDCTLGLMASGSPCDLTHPSTAGYGLLANVDKVYLTGGHRTSVDAGDLVFTFNPAQETPGANDTYFWGLNNYPPRTGANTVVAWIPRKNCVLHKIQYGQSLQTVDSGANNWTFQLCTGGNNSSGSCASYPSALSDTIQNVNDGVSASFASYSVKDLLSPSSSYVVKTVTSSSVGSAATWTPVAIGYCRVVGY
ncbi:MAG: SGNH/GDSL hydrolase family protein [Candidatus Korobacteraceae bacterium]